MCQGNSTTDSDQGWETPGSIPALEASDVHVWRLDIRTAAPGAREVLSDDEQTRADRFRFEEHRSNFIACRAQLRQLLGHYLAQPPEKIVFTYGPFGKPAVVLQPGRPSLRFSVSHSGGEALIAVALDREIGVDLEHIRPGLDVLQLAARFFSPREADYIRGAEPEAQHKAFLTCWTRKEALMKAVGSGLSEPLEQFDVSESLGKSTAVLQITRLTPPRWTLHEIPLDDGFAAVVVEGDIARLRLLHRLSPTP